MEKTCDNCHAFTKKKCFASDGICYLVPSKPRFVKKTNGCTFWKERKEDQWKKNYSE